MQIKELIAFAFNRSVKKIRPPPKKKNTRADWLNIGSAHGFQKLDFDESW